MTKKNLYFLVWTLGASGYLWLYYNYNLVTSTKTSWCVTKKITGYPCPACGSTRSVISILEGDLYQAALLNPFGFLVLLILVLFPLWVLVDILFKKESFYEFYIKIENRLRNKYVAIFGGIIILLNWIWNINKGL